MSGAHTVLHDPHGLVEAELPLDRAPHEALVTAVLAWKNPDVEPRDYEQIALQLTGHARAVASDVRSHAAALPKNDGRGALAEVILREADRRLSTPLTGTAQCSTPASYGPSTPGWTASQDPSRPPCSRRVGSTKSLEAVVVPILLDASSSVVTRSRDLWLRRA